MGWHRDLLITENRDSHRIAASTRQFPNSVDPASAAFSKNGMIFMAIMPMETHAAPISRYPGSFSRNSRNASKAISTGAVLPISPAAVADVYFNPQNIKMR